MAVSANLLNINNTGLIHDKRQKGGGAGGEGTEG